MNRWWSFLNIVLLSVIVLGVSRLEAAPQMMKQVSLVYNGLAWTVDTQATDVAELLVEQIGDYDTLVVQPNPEAQLINGATVTVTDAARQKLNSTVAGNLVAGRAQIAAANTPAPKPVTRPTTPVQSGLATWYRFGDKLTAASRKYPKGTRLKVIAVNSGKSVEVEINDYGPNALTGIDLDLNAPAFEKIAPLGAGKIKVKYYKL